ncbi:hypothetical protein [Pseudomonas lopnurensis]|uniref:hypothetical protein n=1 Tax=Pseudomonas lopnurensis TaxID=1477517 RepID=UPI0028A8CAA2|nr:hypothetical protein [Pseudomonas lopnurensis]
MSTEGKIGVSLILADGYSYTELIPCPDAPDGTPGGGFIRIFHAFFGPDEEAPAPAADMSRPPLTIPENT